MVICAFCTKETKTIHHQLRCPMNPNRKGVPHFSVEKRKEIGKKSKEVNARTWTEEKRKQHSAIMQAVVAQNPESYSTNNVSGRVKMYEVQCDTNAVQVKGKWELQVANWLNQKNIRWTNKVTPYNYFWNNKWHLYFPDFYLPELNILIEVKGYERERDRAKWEAITDKKLIVLKEKEIKDLDLALKLKL